MRLGGDRKERTHQVTRCGVDGEDCPRPWHSLDPEFGGGGDAETSTHTSSCKAGRVPQRKQAECRVGEQGRPGQDGMEQEPWTERATRPQALRAGQLKSLLLPRAHVFPGP